MIITNCIILFIYHFNKMEKKSAMFLAVEKSTIYNSMHVLLKINAIFLYFLFLSLWEEVA